MQIALEIGLILILLVGNGVFALSEIAVISSRAARLQAMSERGSRTARTALAFKREPEKFLSAVQVGITLVGILAGAFGGAALSEDLAALLRHVPLLDSYALPAAFVMIVACITYLSLIIGELVPKQIALSNPEWWACAVAPMMNAIAIAATPVIWLLSRSSALVLSLLHIKPSSDSVVSEEEINVLIAQGATAGIFRHSERDMVARVLHLDEQPVRTLMTHRTELVWLKESDSLSRSLDRMMKAGFSVYPLCDAQPDGVIGLVSLKAVFGAIRERQQGRLAERVSLRKLAVPPLWVRETMKAADLLEFFRQRKSHVALVSDEYGGLAGLVTDHDLLEAIVGRIPGTHDEETAITKRADGTWLVAGWASVSEVEHATGIGAPKDERRTHTMAGLVLRIAGRVPAVGESFQFGQWNIEVIDKDGNRIDQLLVSRIGHEGDQHERG